MLRAGSVAVAVVLAACATEPMPTASPGASATPVATRVATPSAEPADALFSDADSCTNPEIGYTVTQAEEREPRR
jgi:hypothetical protein